MANATVTLYIEKAGIEFECEVEAEGHVACGGSNGHYSDEPEWTEVEDVELFNARGKRVSKRFMDALSAADMEHITDRLIEAG